ncbi:MAG TPA: glycosyltransferase [Patescibacteria group bacterium]|nr:glycosyltransferase [Patescibacteria group bacterium]
MENIKTISLVVPTYKQERTIVSNINELEKVLKELPYSFEIIVVVDGFVDKSYEFLKKLRRSHLKILGYEDNRGKGFAVRFGMLQAKGDIIGFIDGGMDIDPTSILMLVNHFIWYDADIVIGSKLHPVSQVDYPFIRKVLSWGYRTMIRVMFGLKVRDTQVGLKLFKKEVVMDVFPRLLVKRFAFDIEILAVAYARGFRRIYEGPVKLVFGSSSSITAGHWSSVLSENFWSAILHMLWDTSAVFYRLNILDYYDKQRSMIEKR